MKTSLRNVFLVNLMLLVSSVMLLAQPNALDASFINGVFTNTGSGGTSIFCSLVQSNGKIIVAGEFTHYNGVLRNRIARVNADGSLDASFDPGTGADAAIYCMAIQSDGKILIGGDFLTYNGIVRKKYARINTDGTLDETYHTNSSELQSGAVYSIAIQSNGMACMGGTMIFSNANCDKAYIIRLTTLGVLDYGYSDGSSGIGCGYTAKGPVYALALQSDGKLLMGGSFTSSGEISRKGLARLTTSGATDNTFDPGTGIVGTVNSLSIQSDGKIIVGGTFSSYNGTTANKIIRIASNGTIDNTFNTGTGFNNKVHATKIQSDGKVIVAGDFTSYNNSSVMRFIRLNTDGTTDPLIKLSIGPDKAIYTLSLQSNGAVLIGGAFEMYASKSRSILARLQGTDCNVDVTVNQTTASLSANEATATYKWVDCVNASNLLNETAQTYVPSENGTYAVQITKGGCVSESACYSYTSLTTEVDHPFNALDLTYFPNPTEGTLTLEFSTSKNRKVEIMNANGELVSTEILEGKLSDISLKGPVGLYLIRILSEEKQEAVLKVIKN